MDLQPAGRATPMRCGIAGILVCTNTQMLPGKLGRSLRHDAPARNLYETVFASRQDPKSLVERRIAEGASPGLANQLHRPVVHQLPPREQVRPGVGS